MTPSIEGWPTEDKEALSPHEVRNHQQKNFGFLSKLCLLRERGGGLDKSAKKFRFPGESLLFKIRLTTS